MQYIVNLQSFRVEAESEEDAKMKAENKLAVKPQLLIESIELEEK